MAFTLNDTEDLRIDRDPSNVYNLSDARDILFESAYMPTFVRNDNSTLSDDNSLPTMAHRSSQAPKLDQIFEEDSDEENVLNCDKEEGDTEEHEAEEEQPAVLNESTERIQVFLRIRPEVKADNYEIDQEENILWVKNPSKTNKPSYNRFKFDKIFEDSSEQWPIVEKCAYPLLHDLLGGDNSLLFTYGITSSGKSFTMRGSSKQPGIVPTSLVLLFETLANNLHPNQRPNFKPINFNGLAGLSKSDQLFESKVKQRLFDEIQNIGEINREIENFKKFSSTLLESYFESHVCPLRGELDANGSTTAGLWVSYWEVYNEKVYDLLNPGNHTRRQSTVTLKSVNSSSNEKIFIPQGLMQVGLRIYLYGQENLKKHISSTALNSSSSRSHSSFNITLVNSDGHSAIVSNLSFCDLAGRERTKKSLVTKTHLKEANSINQSLLTLGQCIRSLRATKNTTKKPANINYRNSELTKIFQPYLSGSSGRMYIIYNLNPVAELFSDSYYSLDFCTSARDVAVNAARNKAIFEISRHLDDSRNELEASFMEDEEKLQSLRNEVQNLSAHIKEKASELSPCCINNNEELLQRISLLEGKIDEIQRQKQAQEIALRKEMYDATKETQDLYEEIIATKEANIDSVRAILEERLDYNEKVYRRNLEQMRSVLDQTKLSLFQKEEEVIKANSEIESMSVQLESAEMKISDLTNSVLEQTKLQAQIETMSVQLESADIKISELTSSLHEQTNLQSLVESMTDEVKSKDSTIAELKNNLSAKDKAVQKMDKTISTLQKELAPRKDLIIAQLEAELKGKDSEISNLRNALGKTAAEKKRIEDELQAIKEEISKLKEKTEGESSFDSAMSSQENVKPKAVRKKTTRKAKTVKSKLDDDEIELLKSVSKKKTINDYTNATDDMILEASSKKDNYSVKKKLHMSTAKRLDTSPILSPMDAKKNIEAGLTNPYNTRRGNNRKRLF
ncbi:Kinesin-like protein kif20a, partial [Tyrophagus putrescentiae]